MKTEEKIKGQNGVVMTHPREAKGRQPASLITTEDRARNERLQQRTTTFVTRSPAHPSPVDLEAPSRGLHVRMSTLLVNQGPISAAPAGAARTRGRFEKDVTHPRRGARASTRSRSAAVKTHLSSAFQRTNDHDVAVGHGEVRWRRLAQRSRRVLRADAAVPGPTARRSPCPRPSWGGTPP